MDHLKTWTVNIIIISILVLTAYTCTENNTSEEHINFQSNNKGSCHKISEYNPELTLDTDPFTFEDVSISGNCLKIKVIYGGGCKDVSFKLHQASPIMESFPPQMNLFLKLEDDDHCKALVFKELFFDLSSLPLEYNTGTIAFNLSGYSEQIKYTY